MWQRRRVALTGTMVSFLLVGPTVHAQGQLIQVSNAWARRAPMGAMGKGGAMGAMGKSPADKGSMSQMEGGGGTAAVYVTHTNPGAQEQSLVSASSDAAKTVELHETTSEAGVMKMRPVTSIRVPPGGKVEMKPGGYHVMLLGLTHDLKPGDKVQVTLKFDTGADVRVEAPVR